MNTAWLAGSQKRSREPLAPDDRLMCACCFPNFLEAHDLNNLQKYRYRLPGIPFIHIVGPVKRQKPKAW
jgi:hypothetical protein